MSTDIITGLRERPMGMIQFLVVGMCVALNAMDGIDVLSMAFVGPVVSDEWGLRDGQLGVLFSSGLAGMGVGALFVSPYADRLGRKKIILFCLTVMTTGMIASSFAPNFISLACLRLFTGLGIGGMLASLTAIVSEYSSAKGRTMAMAIYSIGFTVGTICGGLISIYLIKEHGWRSVFLCGGLASAVMFPLVLAYLPESLEYLLGKRPPGALQKINTILRRMKWPEIDALPPEEVLPEGEKPKSGFAEIMSPALRMTSFLMASAFGLSFFANYFMANWTPKLIVDLGYSLDGALFTTVLGNVTGITGALVMGFLAARYGIRRIAPIYMCSKAALLLTFAFITGPFLLIMGIFGAMGLVSHGIGVALYTIVAQVFPSSARATGTGFAIGVGRLGAVLGPLVGGMMMEAGFSRIAVLTVIAIPLVLCAVIVFNMKVLKDEKLAGDKGAAGKAVPKPAE